MANMDKSGDRLKAGAQLLNSKLLALANWQRQLTVFTIQKKITLFGWYILGLFGLSNFDLSRLVLAYLLSHNTIHSASRTLFTRSAEHYLVCSRLELFQPEAVVQQLCC